MRQIVDLSAWPQWGPRLLWTAVTIGASYLAGHVVSAILGARLGRLARRRGRDETVIGEFTRRIPLWALLAGAYFSIERWPLSEKSFKDATEALTAVFVASATFAASAVATRLIAVYGPRAAPTAPVSSLAQSVARIVVAILGVLVILRVYAYDITPMLTALGVGGLAVALALQETLANFFAGIVISLAGQVRIGDYVKLDSGAEGYIVDFNWRSARLRQLGDALVIVPNAKLAQAVVTNYSLPAPLVGASLDATVERSANLADVERLALEVAAAVQREVEGALPGTPPSFRYQGLAERGVRFQLAVRAREFGDVALLKHELVKRLQTRLAKEGIRLR